MMRQRIGQVGQSGSFREEPESSDESNSDLEEAIKESHPDENAFLPHNDDDDGMKDESIQSVSLHQGLVRGTTWWGKCLSISAAAFLTYSYTNVGAASNVQIAIMTVIALVGASPFSEFHLVPASIGAFVGGNNIIGATGLDSFGATEIKFVSYLWLLLLSWAVGVLWCFFAPMQRLLDGRAGKLGTFTFVGMNLVTIAIWGPVGVVDWNRFYFGFVHSVHVAEEDSASPLAGAWEWSQEAELAIGYVLAVVWLAIAGGATRILHHQHIQRLLHRKTSFNPYASPDPLNNILVPVLWALLSMLVVNATGYKHAPGLYNGFAVGSYVAMASLQKIPSILKFAAVALIAAGWGLALTPVFVGFAGKAGFTAFMGHLTYDCSARILLVRARKQEEQLEAARLQEQLYHQQLLEQQEQRQQEQKEKEQQQQQQQESPSQPQIRPKHEETHSQEDHPSKPIKPILKEPLLTKQQRRQRQRLQHQLQQKVHQDIQPPTQHHRAWSALPKEGDAAWAHPLI